MENMTLMLKKRRQRIVQAENYPEAIVKYTEALKYDANNAVLYSNRSLSYLKLKMYQQALSDSIECINNNPQWIKGMSGRHWLIKDWATKLK